MEPTPRSPYRLKHTFLASLTSYRIIMFLNTFRLAARGSQTQLRSEAFVRHGAPPFHATSQLLRRIRHIHAVGSFRAFLDVVGIQGVGPEAFTALLRACARSARERGYLRVLITQGQGLGLRVFERGGVEVAVGVVAEGGVGG